MSDLNLEGAPDSPIERLNWLFEREVEFLRDLHVAYSRAYFDARLGGQLDDALGLHLHGKKKVLAMTRRENYRRGSSVRWQDNIDRRSAPYWD
jgi:hypothetical protein